MPWRLTRDERKILEKRTRNISWSHYVEPMYYRGASFWSKPSRMWKSHRKYRLFLFILPVLLRDKLPRLRVALLLLISDLRKLDGQVHSYQTVTRKMGILPGSRSLKHADVDSISDDLIRALVLLEGCVPIGHLIPVLHHVVHYGQYAKSHGMLRIYWMMAFERCEQTNIFIEHIPVNDLSTRKTQYFFLFILRYNKFIKSLVNDNNKAEKNLSRNVVLNAGCNFERLSKRKTFDQSWDNCHKCFLKSKASNARDVITDSEFFDLLSIGCPVKNRDELTVYDIAMIMNKHFRAGEWGMWPRCGSVVTCVINGRSVYARVIKFVRVNDEGDECPGYACVNWFSEPTYVNSLCPHVNLNGDDIYTEVGVNVIRITQIDPSQVHVETVPGTDGFYMMRDSGYDTRRC